MFQTNTSSPLSRGNYNGAQGRGGRGGRGGGIMGMGYMKAVGRGGM